MSTVYQNLADTAKAKIQDKVDEVHQISAKVDALDAEIRGHHEAMRQKNEERSRLSSRALELLGEIAG